MKTTLKSILLFSVAASLLGLGATPATNPANRPAAAPNRASDHAPPPASAAPVTTAPAATAPAPTTAPPADVPTVTPAVAPVAVPPAAPTKTVASENAKDLRLNFRGVPLNMVLNYLSDAAGFIINVDTSAPITGKVDVWSNQPLDKTEAVQVLDSVLNKNGYAAIRNGRMLTIVNLDNAKQKNLPVKVYRPGSDYQTIPNNDQMVTQIIPIRYANAVQMVQNLQQLLPTFASLSANQSGNALILTDTQSDIRRMVQIVSALDTSISSIATIKVFPLQYADAKELATEITSLFPNQNNNNNNNFPRPPFMRFRRGGGNNQNQDNSSEAREAASRVTAVADEATNSLIVSAPDAIIPVIQQLVDEIDKKAEDITELRVFHLKHSDPQQIVDLLTSLFPDQSNSSNNNRRSFRFGRGRFFGRPGGNGQSEQSSRAQAMVKVTAVADPRTSSVIVSAATSLMPQISQMIDQLDANPANKERVFVYNLQNANPQDVQQVMQDLFNRNNTMRTSNNRNTLLQNNPLIQRETQQSTSLNSSTMGSSRGGGSTMGGGLGGGF